MIEELSTARCNRSRRLLYKSKS